MTSAACEENGVCDEDSKWVQGHDKTLIDRAGEVAGAMQQQPTDVVAGFGFPAIPMVGRGIDKVIDEVFDPGSTRGDAEVNRKIKAGVTLLGAVLSGGDAEAAGAGESVVGAAANGAANAEGAATRVLGTVFRGLAAGENPAAGLIARDAAAGNSIASHVAGARATQWISTTRSLEIATSRFGANGVVAIDLSKVGSPVVDLTNGIPGLPRTTMLSRWSIRTQEVVIRGSIPADAITPITRIP